MTSDRQDPAKRVFAYHEQTKHHLHRYARSLGYMDWDNQPHPFRHYGGAERVALPLSEEENEPSYSHLYSARGEGAERVEKATIGRFLELGLGLSAWKRFGGSQWSLRMNPSSGNLHPTESYLLLPQIGSLPACLAHYNPYFHALEVRARVGATEAQPLAAWGGFGIILTSIVWREAWKYGERAFRYCHHDVGHALAALSFSANLLGWRLTLLPDVGQLELDRLLGFDRIGWPEGEEEHADCLAWVSAELPPSNAIHSLVDSAETLAFTGRPNRLSDRPVPWDIIRSVSEASRSPGEPVRWTDTLQPPKEHFVDSPLSAPAIIRRRRSAQALDFRRSRIDRETFLSMLERTLPGGYAPFGGFPFEPRAHLALFVHAVEGLDAGLYILIRNAVHRDELRSSLDRRFAWEQPEAGFPLYRLEDGDFRQTAMTISCHQEIAGAGAFSLGMLARFRPCVQEQPWSYPRLFWETGLIGQVLYLEAEAHALRGTGIGCFFDDEMHRLLGLKDDTFQSLYHFTVGVPLEDPRLQTLAPYHHLETSSPV